MAREITAAALHDLGAHLATVPEVTDYQAYAGLSAPINFNGLVRQYYLRAGAEQGDLQVNLAPKDERRRKSHDIAKALHERGARIAFAYQGDRFRSAVEDLAKEFRDPVFVECDVASDEQVDACFQSVGKEMAGLEMLVHSIASAKREELSGNFRDTSRDGSCSGSGRRNTWLISVKTVVLAPMPRPSDSAATRVSTGLRPRSRMAKRMSFSMCARELP